MKVENIFLIIAICGAAFIVIMFVWNWVALQFTLRADKIVNFFKYNWLNLIFCILFAFTCFIIGGSIVGNSNAGVIFGAILFAIIGFFVALGIFKIFNVIVKKLPTKTKNLVLILLSIIVLFFMVKVAMIARDYSPTPHYNNKTNTHKDYSDGDYYEDYDYDKDGEINQKEWEDALGDYMDKVMY